MKINGYDFESRPEELRECRVHGMYVHLLYVDGWKCKACQQAAKKIKLLLKAKKQALIERGLYGRY